MPYAPGITDRSGEILAAGIAKAAEEYAATNEKMQLTQKEIDHLTGTVQFAAQKQILTPEELQQFAQGNLSKKREIASRAGMLYQDMQAQADRALQKSWQPSPEEARRLLQNNYVRVGRSNWERLDPQYQLPPDVEAEMSRTHYRVGPGPKDWIPKPEKSGLQVTPIPGTDYVAPTLNGRSLGTLPVSGKTSFQPTPEMLQAADEGGYQYLQTDKGFVLRATRGGTSFRPTAAQPLVDEIYRSNGLPTTEELKRRQSEILAAIADKRETYSVTNALGETRGEEMRRLAAELATREKMQASPPRPQPMQAPAQKSGIIAPRGFENADLSGLPQALAPYAKDYVAAAQKFGLNPRFLAAVSAFETGGGTSKAFLEKNNAMGISDTNGPIALPSVRDSIFRQAETLARADGPYKNANTIEEIGKIYAPVGASNDPRGTNGGWAEGVNSWVGKIGRVNNAQDGSQLPPLPDTPVKIESVEQYFALPSGAKFYDAKGNIRQKK